MEHPFLTRLRDERKVLAIVNAGLSGEARPLWGLGDVEVRRWASTLGSPGTPARRERLVRTLIDIGAEIRAASTASHRGVPPPVNCRSAVSSTDLSWVEELLD